MTQIACIIFLVIWAYNVWREAKLGNDIFSTLYNGTMGAALAMAFLFIMLAVVAGAFGGYSK